MSTGYIHDLRKSGQIHHYMTGNTAFFKKSDIDELLEEHKACRNIGMVKVICLFHLLVRACC